MTDKKKKEEDEAYSEVDRPFDLDPEGAKACADILKKHEDAYLYGEAAKEEQGDGTAIEKKVDDLLDAFIPGGLLPPQTPTPRPLEEKLDRIIELLESVIGDGGNGWSVVYTCPGQEPGL